MVDSLRGLLLIVAVVATSGIALFQPFTGLMGFLVFSIANPQSLVWSVQIPPVLPIAGATILGYVVSSEPKRLPRAPETYMLLGLWAVFVVSTLTAIYPDLAFPFLTHVSKILLMVFISMALVTTKERLVTLLRVIVLSLGVIGLKAGVFAISTGGQFMIWGPENSFLESNNTIGVALSMNLPLLFYFRRLEQRRWLRYLMLAMLLLSYPAIVCTFSRGAWLTATVATGFIVWKNRFRWLAVPAILLVLPLLSAEMFPDRVVSRYSDLQNYEEEASAQSRFWNWEFCRRVGVARPLTGAGFNFPSETTVSEYYPEFFAVWHGKVWACHSTWMTVFAEHGVPGFALWVGLLGTCFVSTRRVRKLARQTGAQGAWTIPVADMTQGALIAYAVGGTFVDLNYFDIFYQLVAVVVLLKSLAPKAPERATAASSSGPRGQLGRGAVVSPEG
jgi:probable O-glycosylation ligase (exosortase A-associated)